MNDFLMKFKIHHTTLKNYKIDFPIKIRRNNTFLG